MSSKLTLCGAVLASCIMAGSVFAHSGAAGVVKERMDMMESIKDAMKMIAPMAKGQVEMDEAVIRKGAQMLQQNSGEGLAKAFPKDSIHGPSEALPAIWVKWDIFSNLNNELHDLSKELEQNAGNPELAVTTFKKVAGTCASCHQQFKKD